MKDDFIKKPSNDKKNTLAGFSQRGKYIAYIYIYIYIHKYIYIMGVTVHKIHSSVRYDTVMSRLFGMFSNTGAGKLFTAQCWKYFCFKP